MLFAPCIANNRLITSDQRNAQCSSLDIIL